MRQQNKFISLM